LGYGFAHRIYGDIGLFTDSSYNNRIGLELSGWFPLRLNEGEFPQNIKLNYTPFFFFKRSSFYGGGIAFKYEKLISKNITIGPKISYGYIYSYGKKLPYASNIWKEHKSESNVYTLTVHTNIGIGKRSLFWIHNDLGYMYSTGWVKHYLNLNKVSNSTQRGEFHSFYAQIGLSYRLTRYK